jgi:GGDEF domain-containing protein
MGESDHDGQHGRHESTLQRQSAVDILKQAVGEAMLVSPTDYLPESQTIFHNIEYRKDEKTGLAIFEKEARVAIVNELNEALDQGGEVGVILYDCDGLKEANDKVSHVFGDYNIMWGSSYPLHLLKELGLSSQLIVVRPEGSPDDTMIFVKNPTPEDKVKIQDFVNKLNNPSSGKDITVMDNEGNPRIHTLSTTAGVSYSPADLREIARRRRKDYDLSPDFSVWTDDDLDKDLSLLKKSDPEGYKFAIIEGLRQVADDRAHEAKGEKQLEVATAWLETLVGLSIEDFDIAEEKRFGGSRVSRVVRKLINETRRERYFEKG